MRGQRRAAPGAAAGHHVKNTVRHAGLGCQFRYPQQGQRRGFRRLNDDRAAGRQRGHHFPHADHQREVPRHDPGYHAHRLFFGPRLIACALREGDRYVEGAATDFSGQPGGIAHPVQRTAHFKGAGNVNRFPLFKGLQLRQLLAVLLHQIGEAQQDPLAVGGRPPCPTAGNESAPGGHHRPIDIRGVGIRGAGDSLTGGRIPDG